MDFSAVSHQAYEPYCYPLNGDELRITLQTGKDITAAYLIYGDPFKSERTAGGWRWRSERIPLPECKALPYNLLWAVTVRPEFKRCKYYFELSDGQQTRLFFENGFLSPEEFAERPESGALFIFPWMNEVDVVRPPRWAAQTVWYQIFPARFCKGRATQAPGTLLPWPRSTQRVTNAEQYGGNLDGITQRLGYLHELGITGLYLNPINRARSQHKYDTTDYLTIDPEFGTEQDLVRLVQEAHAHGMRVMLDGVFNHSGWDFFAWQDVLKNGAHSPYADWYIVNDYDIGTSPAGQAHSGKYYSFAFTDTMPKLNTSNPAVRGYIIQVCETWVRRYDIDALRLDVANEISHELCRELRSHLRALKPEFFIVGEIWNNALPWLRGAEFDSVINYPLRTVIHTFAADRRRTVLSLEEQLNRCLSMYTEQTVQVLINQMDSHDTARLITKTSGDTDGTLLQFALILALPGSACLYYGTEVLLPGGEDPDCRRCMPWDEIDSGCFAETLSLMRQMIHVRTSHAALRSAQLAFVYPPDDATGAGRVVQVVRTDAASGERVTCAFNFGTEGYALAQEGKQVLVSRKYAGGVLEPGGFVWWQ